MKRGKLKRHNGINNCTAGAGYGTKGCGTFIKENTQGMPEKEEYYYRMAEQNKVDEQRKIKGEEIETLTILPVEFAEGGTIR